MNIEFPSKKSIFQWALFIGIFSLVIYFYLPGHSKYHELKRKEEQLDQKIEALEAEIEKMKEDKKLLENDVDYLEKVVRERMGRVEPGETIYKVVDTPEEDATYQIVEGEEADPAIDA